MSQRKSDTESKYAGLLPPRQDAEQAPAATAPRGRPRRGKKSDPKYVQVTVYMTREKHEAAKERLWDNGHLQFSDLVDQLVGTWLAAPEMPPAAVTPPQSQTPPTP